MTLVRTLLEIPELRMRLRAGGDLLDRVVTRIYGTELPDPSRYLSAGELVLSGLLWWRGPDDAEPFVAALAHARCAALAASGADTGGIPDELVAACERHRMPLLEVPADLSFAVVTERVVLALADESGGARKRLLSAAAEDASLPTLLTHAATELGADCWVCSATGRVVAASASGAPQERTVLPVGGRSAVPWSLVVGAELGPGLTEVAEELASLVGLARAREDEVRRVRMRVAAPLLALLADPAGSAAELATAFAATGLPADLPLRVLLARAPGAGDILGELLAEHRGPVFIGELGDAGEACALVPADDGWPSDWPATATRALERLGGGRVLIGIGGPATMPGLRGASEEARHALGAAARRAERVAVLSGEEIGVHRLLLAGAPDELRRALRERTLGPLAGHPELLRTVRVYLECSGSPARAAKALHVHVNTLRYRLARAGELLGADLTDFRTQVDVYLALSVDN
ncbi:PucR family transcriptional regulator [Prauserella sp. PE36]|uniref:PucR family transcriptional regulator n=1 Tax=Prauserella endophytica TaxID=1592324 RepID=A0ABY2S5Z5_9PSEU|nr:MULTISPECIES: PucR family transcriptional regulator ligand-binding domain-containing protein [Prauserella]PXY26116.1 PucR family transcriptional regulator [Prauserella coralliicola]RBM19929.1 PucR family transcriptional regulator [Prauserella sp. PE36]TKG71335.1 PucR family transcriptional regulator [Prauserella endophytica]